MTEYYKKIWEKELSEKTNDLQKEVDGLREEVRVLRWAIEQDDASWRALKAENARYREALYSIACYEDAENEQSLDEPHAAKIAREALKGGE